jgi:hypothetical protein
LEKFGGGMYGTTCVGIVKMRWEPITLVANPIELSRMKPPRWQFSQLRDMVTLNVPLELSAWFMDAEFVHIAF